MLSFAGPLASRQPHRVVAGRALGMCHVGSYLGDRRQGVGLGLWAGLRPKLSPTGLRPKLSRRPWRALDPEAWESVPCWLFPGELSPAGSRVQDSGGRRGQMPPRGPSQTFVSFCSDKPVVVNAVLSCILSGVQVSYQTRGSLRNPGARSQVGRSEGGPGHLELEAGV